MMMNTNNNINCFADLDREEMRVKRRINKQEDAIKIKLQSLPDEIISAGIAKAISGILNGNFFKSALSIIKTVGPTLMEGNKDGSNSGGNIISIIKNFIKSKLSV